MVAKNKKDIQVNNILNGFYNVSLRYKISLNYKWMMKTEEISKSK